MYDDNRPTIAVVVFCTVFLTLGLLTISLHVRDIRAAVYRMETAGCAGVTAQVEDAWLAARQARDSITVLQRIIADRDQRWLQRTR